MIRLACLAALGVLLLAGCSPAGRPLVQVGSQTVTVQDFERASREAEGRYPGPPDVAKETLLDDLVRRAVMLEYAHRTGLDRDTALVTADRENERRALVQALFARIGSPAQPVSEAEARAMYEERKQQAEVWLIYTTSRSMSLAAQARLRAGEPFPLVSRAFSAAGLLPPDGNMGLITPGSLPEPLDTAVRTQAIGEIGGPYETREGWFLMKITKRLPHEQGPYDAQRAGLVDLMRQRKQRAAFTRAYQDMKEAWQMQLVPGGGQLLFHVISPVEPLQPTPDQRRALLATYSGGTYALQDALADLQNVNTQRPPTQMLTAIEIWIESQVMTRVAVLEARRRHLEQEPEVVASLRGKHDQMLLEGVYQRAVASVPPPGPELVQMAWERVKDRFTNLVEAQLAVVESPDSALMAKVVLAGQKTRSLADAAKLVDPSLAVSEITVKYPNNDAEWNTMLAMFTQMQPGGWFGPESTPKGWRVLQLVNKSVAQQSFDQLPEGLRQNIAGSAGDLARDARFRSFTDSLSRAYLPRVNRVLVARVAWPAKPPLDVGR